LRQQGDPRQLRGPRWLASGAQDLTALGSPTVLGLTVLAVTGYLLLHGLYRNGLFIFVASVGGWVLNWLLKAAFARSRPDIVPHLREVMSSSFPSGHALTSAAVYLTLGALLMRIAAGRLAKYYCIAIAMLLTFLVGTSRVVLGVHYPTDVVAGWLIGMSWALLCWVVERTVERRVGLKREKEQVAKQGSGDT
jgi:undecaprenyl-diphosphatase